MTENWQKAFNDVLDAAMNEIRAECQPYTDIRWLRLREILVGVSEKILQESAKLFLDSSLMMPEHCPRRILLHLAKLTAQKTGESDVQEAKND